VKARWARKGETDGGAAAAVSAPAMTGVGWPPLLAGRPERGVGRTLGLLSEKVARAGRSHNGWPLYYFARDIPGSALGQVPEEAGIWSPEGHAIGVGEEPEAEGFRRSRRARLKRPVVAGASPVPETIQRLQLCTCHTERRGGRW